MEEKDRERIRDDLKGIIKGDLLFDDIARILYSTDASIFHVRPLGIVAPRDEEDVQALVRYAAEHRLPLSARGAGSGFAGESLGSGLIVDMSRHFRTIVEMTDEEVRVEPGVVLRHLNEELAKVGRRFAPDPASAAQCTIGGMIATNASGTRLLRHGYTREHVRGMRVVLDTGDAVGVGNHSYAGNGRQTTGHLDDIVVSVSELLHENSALIAACQPRTPFNRCGYLLDDVLTPAGINIARLLVGSEGTLAITTEVTLRTIPLPAERSLVVFSFADLDSALRASSQAVTARPAACELLDHRLLTLARGAENGTSHVPSTAHAALFVEFESDSAGEAREAAVALADWLHRTQRLAIHSYSATDDDEIDRIWAMRSSAIERLFQLRGDVQAVPLAEDVGVPVTELPGFLHRVQDILQRHETTAAFLIHAGTGQVHTRPFLDLENPEHVSRLWAIADEIHSGALDVGGTVSTQHGSGLARTPWISRQYGRLHPVLRDIKSIFDPHGIFNPGKIISSEPDQLTWRLRGRMKNVEPIADPVIAPEAATAGPRLRVALPESFALRWQPSEFRNESASCNGCGACRTEAAAQRMCPIFRASLSEDATPRAKANLMRALLESDAEMPPLSAVQVREVANLCVNCKMCARECPAHVNVPKLMLEAKAANVAEHGLDRSDWVLARTESFAAFGSAFSLLVNAALGSRGCRWVMEKLFGVSRKRRLPAFAARSFLRRASRRGWARQPISERPRVAYFVDVFANYNDPQIGEAVVAVLQHHDIDVHVPLGQVGCGIAALAQGDVDTAREAAKTNLRVLADIAREGHAIVCSEPTAAVMLRHDYLDLLDDPDAKLVAERTVELTDFLGELHQLGRLRTNFRSLPLSIGHHVPCHLKALGRPAAAPQLLSLIPGMTVRTIDVSCSGMAGTYGLKAENYEMSLKAGEPMLSEFRRPDIRFGSSECSACRMQMEEGGHKRALHPVQYLALAYGLMPDLSRRLERPMSTLVVR
jgi:FAD/FMN-containing dehydrogenase/Fe-S oxidoreductase